MVIMLLQNDPAGFSFTAQGELGAESCLYMSSVTLPSNLKSSVRGVSEGAFSLPKRGFFTFPTIEYQSFPPLGSLVMDISTSSSLFAADISLRTSKF